MKTIRMEEMNWPDVRAAIVAGFTTAVVVVGSTEPDLVTRDRLVPGYVGTFGEKELQIIFQKGMPALTENGVIGDPRNASANKGNVYLEKLSRFLAGEFA